MTVRGRERKDYREIKGSSFVSIHAVWRKKKADGRSRKRRGHVVLLKGRALLREGGRMDMKSKKGPDCTKSASRFQKGLFDEGPSQRGISSVK